LQPNDNETSIALAKINTIMKAYKMLLEVDALNFTVDSFNKSVAKLQEQVKKHTAIEMEKLQEQIMLQKELETSKIQETTNEVLEIADETQNQKDKSEAVTYSQENVNQIALNPNAKKVLDNINEIQQM
jgi:hypothetical protein